MLSAYEKPLQPVRMLISASAAVAFRGYAEGWDRRRIKRELRKGAKSTYRR